MSRTRKQKREAEAGRNRRKGQGKGGRRRDTGAGPSGGGGGNGNKRRGSLQWRKESYGGHGHGLFVEGGALADWRPCRRQDRKRGQVQGGHRHAQWNGQSFATPVDFLRERAHENLSVMSYYYPNAEIVLPALPGRAEVYVDRKPYTDVLEKLKAAQATELEEIASFKNVESSIAKDEQGFSGISFKTNGLLTPEEFYTQGGLPCKNLESATVHQPPSFRKKFTSRSGLESKKLLKQGCMNMKLGGSQTVLTSSAWNGLNSECSSRSFDAASLTSCSVDSSENSKVSLGLDTSDIDEELAEDYVSNLAGEIPLDLLETEMSLRNVTLSQTPIDSMIINSQCLEVLGGSKFLCESSDEEAEDSELNKVWSSKAAYDKKVFSCQSGVSKGKKVDEDLEIGLFSRRTFFKEDSGYNSEEASREEDGFLNEEYRFQYLALDNATDHDCDSEDQSDEIIQEREGHFVLESRAFCQKFMKQGKPAHLKHGTMVPNKFVEDGLPGQKKRRRKETIAAKRREHALSHGVNFEAINLVLQRMVENHGNIFAFDPMTNRDRSMVHRLASSYGLRSSSQGSGKKRFVVVTRMQHTSLPSRGNERRLLKLLGQNGGEDLVIAQT